MISDKCDKSISCLINRIQDIGRAQEKLRTIQKDEIFDNISKHNPYWDSEYEIEADKLENIRLRLNCLHENLWDVWAILRKEDEDL